MPRKKRPSSRRAETRAAARESRPVAPRVKSDFAESAARYAVYAIAGLLPLTIISTQEFILWETPKVAFLNIATLGALLAWANKIIRSGVVEFRRPPFIVPVLAYFAVYTAATAFSFSPVLSIFGVSDRSMGLINLTNLVVLYLLVFNVLTRPEQQVRCLKIFVLGATVVAFLGVLQYFGVTPFNILPYLKGQRIGSTLGNPDYGTPVIVLALPLAVAFLLKKRFWYAISVVLLFMMLIFSLPIPGLTGNWVFSVPQESLGEGVGGVAATVKTVAVERVEARRGLWEAGIGGALAYPVLGTGPNTYRDIFTVYEPLHYVRMLPDFREDKPHNEFIEVAQSTGFLGLAAYLWMLANALLLFSFWFWRNRKHAHAPFVAAIVVSTGGYLAYTFLLFHTIAAYTVFWILLGVGAGICQSNPAKVETRKVPALRPMALYGALLSVVILTWVGFLALRPVFADLAEARGRGIAVTDERSGRMVTEWFKRAADWHPFEYLYVRNAAHAFSNLGASLKKTPVTDPLFQEGFYYIDRAQRQEPRNATVYFNRALIYQRSGRSVDEVVADLNRAIELYPYYIVAYNALADVERNRGNFEKAIELRRTALDITPDNGGFMVEIGYDHLQASQFPPAIEMLEKGIKAGSDSARARFLLGGSYELSGNYEEARKAYEAALKADPNHTRAREGLQRVTGVG